jgi:hypothetical protein
MAKSPNKTSAKPAKAAVPKDTGTGGATPQPAEPARAASAPAKTAKPRAARNVAAAPKPAKAATSAPKAVKKAAPVAVDSAPASPAPAKPIKARATARGKAPAPRPVRGPAVAAAPPPPPARTIAADPAKPDKVKGKARRSMLKETSARISQLASDILADRIIPTIEQIKAIAASALGQDESKGKKVKRKKK